MSDTLEQLHAQAFLNLLAADAELTVYDGVVPADVDPPYALVYSTISWPADGAANALNALAVTVNAEFNVHCVGLTAAAARAVQAQVRQTALNARPTVTGRQCGLIEMSEALAPNRDETTGRLVMDAVVIFNFLSTP